MRRSASNGLLDRIGRLPLAKDVTVRRCALKARTLRLSLGEFCTINGCLDERGVAEVGAAEIASLHIGAVENTTLKICAPKIREQKRLRKVCARKSGVPQVHCFGVELLPSKRALAAPISLYEVVPDVRHGAMGCGLTSPMSGRAGGRSPLAKVRLDGPVMPHSHRRTLPLYAAYSGPKSEDNTRSSGLIWN